MKYGLCVLIFVAFSLGQSIPEVAERGVKYFQAGRYAMAEKQFGLALQKSIVEGNQDWIASSMLNLLTLYFDVGKLVEAQKLLSSFPPQSHRSGMENLFHWKWGQYYQLAGMEDSAHVYYELAEKYCSVSKKCSEIKIDRLQSYLVSKKYQSSEKERLKKKIDVLKNSENSHFEGELSGLKGLWALRAGDYEQAVEEWTSAVNYFQSNKYYSRMAKSLKYLAMTYIKLGRAKEAEAAVDRSLVVYEMLDLPKSAYQVALLKLFIIKEPEELSNYKRNLDFFGNSPEDRNWEKTFVEVKQIADISPSPMVSSLFPEKTKVNR